MAASRARVSQPTLFWLPPTPLRGSSLQVATGPCEDLSRKDTLCGVDLIILYRCKWLLREQRLRACTTGRIPRTWNASDLKKTWWSQRSSDAPGLLEVSGHFFCITPLFCSRLERTTTRTLCVCSSSMASGLVPSTVLYTGSNYFRSYLR
jgi:hypothetical protein